MIEIYMALPLSPVCRSPLSSFSPLLSRLSLLSYLGLVIAYFASNDETLKDDSANWEAAMIEYVVANARNEEEDSLYPSFTLYMNANRSWGEGGGKKGKRKEEREKKGRGRSEERESTKIGLVCNIISLLLPFCLLSLPHRG